MKHDANCNWCPLCGSMMDFHIVMTEPIKTSDGRSGVKAIGWRCPEKPKKTRSQ